MKWRAWAVVCLLVLSAGAAEAVPFTVKSFNIRNSNQNSWSVSDTYDDNERRGDRVIQSILENEPDVIGLQEVLPDQAQDITRALLLEGYTGFSVPREDGGEASSVYWKQDRFFARSSSTFFLNLQPALGLPHQLDGDGEPPRIVSVVEFQDLENGETFFFANTHFPSSSGQAINGKPVPDLTVQELIEITLIDATVPQALKFDGGGWLDNQRIPGAGEILAAMLLDIAGGAPLVLTGDFNMSSNVFAYDILTGASGSEYVSGFGLTDTYAEIFGPASTLTLGHGTLAFDPDSEFSFGTNPTTSRGRIDYIFASKDFEVVSSEIEREQYFIFDCDSGEVCWKYASDHYPVTSVIELADADTGGGGDPPGEEPPTTPVPLPAGAWLLLTGLAGLAAVSRRRA